VKKSAWGLFVLVGTLWGIPYLFTKVAVDSETPVVLIVFLRVLLASLILIPIAHFRGVLIPAFRHWKIILLYAVGEMVLPWFFIATGQKVIPSSTTALLIATVPIFASVFAYFYGDSTVWHGKRLVGMGAGFVGIFFLVGFDGVGEGSVATQTIAVILLLASSILYAGSVSMVNHKLPEVSGLAINAIALLFATLIYLPTIFFIIPTPIPPADALISIAVLGAICTALAFIIYFQVMAHFGPARASLSVYINTVVAVLLGVILLDEKLTPMMMLGIPLVLIGSYLASRKPIATPA
jgi:drug/metabolite transporter (DMT)-like permease